MHNGINGVTNQGKDITIGNPNLKPEVSTSSELGLYYENPETLSANITYFHTRFSDKIASVKIPNCAVSSVAECITVGNYSTQETFSKPVNLDKARTQGVELNSEIPFLEQFALRLNYTYTDSRQLSGADKDKPLTYTPRHMANARISWQATEKLSTWLSTTYHGSSVRFTNRYNNLSAQQKAEYNLMGDSLRAYTLFDLGARYQINETVSVNLVVYNLLDKDFLQYEPYTYDVINKQGKVTGTAVGYANKYARSDRATYGTIDEGRRFWLSTNITF
ncbi:MAG: TonB-dependent receptor domain-containing protein [Enterobacteriaceae bacterium]